MGSPISEMIYQYTGIDMIYFIGGFAVLTIILLILMIVSLCKLKKLRKKYEAFTRGKNGESLEDTVKEYLDKVDHTIDLLTMTREELINLRKNQKIAFQKMGMVRYDAFLDLTGQLSYSLALLDKSDNGFVLNSVYSREGSYSYIKEIKAGECEIELSKEEKQALDQAKNRVEK